jgi:hypothetical protein
MSSIKLESNPSGSGIFTIASPNSNTNRTLTIPDATGTIDRLNRAGNVLQVVNATYGTLTTSTTASFADTGLTATITPSNTSSKILVLVNCCGLSKSANNTYMGLRLLRDSTTIFLFATQAGFTGGSVQSSWGGDGTNYLDSPATTSATTYKIQMNNAAATGTVTINDGTSLNGSTITLMEIAA